MTSIIRHFGKSLRWSVDPDNPRAPNFKPPSERDHQGQARWWAMAAWRDRRQDRYDAAQPKPVDVAVERW